MENHYTSRDNKCSLNLRQMLELSKRKNQGWKNDLLENQKWMDAKMRRQTIIHDLMVANRDRMIEKCKCYEEHLEQIKLDNARFKRTTQCLLDEVDKMAGDGSIDKRSENGDKDNKDFEDDNKLEVSYIV